MKLTFEQEVSSILLNFSGWQLDNVYQTIRYWELFVEQCELGYHFGIYEYDNDIRGRREVIEAILNNPNLKSFSREFKAFNLQITTLDSRLKSMFLPHHTRNKGNYWWEKGILKYAGEEYAHDIYEETSIEIEIV